jgi:hypothetical protein
LSHLSVQTELETVSANLHYYDQKQVQLLSLLSVNTCTVFSKVLNECSTVIFLDVFPSALFISAGSRDSAVGIVTGYGLDDKRVGV